MIMFDRYDSDICCKRRKIKKRREKIREEKREEKRRKKNKRRKENEIKFFSNNITIKNE